MPCIFHCVARKPFFHALSAITLTNIVFRLPLFHFVFSKCFAIHQMIVAVQRAATTVAFIATGIQVVPTVAIAMELAER